MQIDVEVVSHAVVGSDIDESTPSPLHDPHSLKAKPTKRPNN